MYRTPRNAGVLLALGLVSVSQFTWAGYKFEDGDLSGEFSFSAGGSTITARNINFGAGVKDLRSGKDRGTKTTWQEIYVKPKVAFDYKLNPDLSLLAARTGLARARRFAILLCWPGMVELLRYKLSVWPPMIIWAISG